LALPRERHDPEARPLATGAPPPAHQPARGLAFLAGRDGICGLRLRAVRPFRRICWRSSAAPASIRPPSSSSGRCFGPAQVASRLCEFAFGAPPIPLNLARTAFGLIVCAFVVLGLAGISAPVAAAFAIMFGVANGLVTIARGTVPLVLFGPAGYGRLMGRIAGPWLVMQSAAPLVLAFVAERLSDAARLRCGLPSRLPRWRVS